MKNIIVFTSSELGGAERSLTRMALASPSGLYKLATLDGEGPWCDGFVTRVQPLVLEHEME